MRSSLRSSRRLIDWACALVEAAVPMAPRIQGTSLMPMCTKHFEGCGCARGTVRRFHTNHHKTSTSTSFNKIRNVLGAVVWHQGGDIERVA